MGPPILIKEKLVLGPLATHTIDDPIVSRIINRKLGNKENNFSLCTVET